MSRIEEGENILGLSRSQWHAAEYNKQIRVLFRQAIWGEWEPFIGEERNQSQMRIDYCKSTETCQSIWMIQIESRLSTMAVHSFRVFIHLPNLMVRIGDVTFFVDRVEILTQSSLCAYLIPHLELTPLQHLMSAHHSLFSSFCLNILTHRYFMYSDERKWRDCQDFKERFSRFIGSAWEQVERSRL